jgi:thiamine biosynthesis lipoprotein
VHRVEEQWGTVISIDAPDLDDASSLDACFAWFQRIDDLFSTWRDETEIMRLGRGELELSDASSEVREVLALSEQMRLESNGAFDIRAGGHPNAAPRPGRAPIDPSGIVKGWAVQRAGEMLDAAGSARYFINAGGDIVVRSSWRVGIQHPWERDKVAVVVDASDCGVATSGLYERGDHVLDPRTGEPAIALASATVIGPDLAVADAFATTTVVLGADAGMPWLATRVGYEGMCITDDHTVIVTPGFDRFRVS